jgi:hypothetical protein
MRYSIHTLPQVPTHSVPVLRGRNPDTATGLGLIMAGYEYLLDRLSGGNDCRTASDAEVGCLTSTG